MKLLISTVLVFLPCLPAARGQSPDEKKKTIAYLRALQTKEGGFLPMKPLPRSTSPARTSLRATSAALRALKYFGGDAPDRDAARKFVESCFDMKTGAFVDHPSTGDSGSIITAVGLMAVAELKIPVDNYVPAIAYMSDNARSFEEIRMAAAGLESVGKSSPKATEWIRSITTRRNADGAYGKGTALARDTGGSVAAILRLGGKIERPERVLKALKDGQRTDGGFGKADVDSSDLETSYRVLRAFVMLKQKPAHVASLRAFVGRCRHPDGGYGIAPGKTSTVASTYFAATILHWLAES